MLTNTLCIYWLNIIERCWVVLVQCVVINGRCLKWFTSARRHAMSNKHPLHCKVLLVKFKMLHPNAFVFSAQLHCKDSYCTFWTLTFTRSK
jgi:hypothetical protein